MSEDYVVNSVRSYSTDLVGRSLNTMRNHHIIIDSPTIGEEITSGDAFLAGISSCGVNLVAVAARDGGVPLQRIEVTIEGVRRKSDPSWFEKVNLTFNLIGPTEDQARALVAQYQER